MRRDRCDVEGYGDANGIQLYHMLCRTTKVVVKGNADGDADADARQGQAGGVRRCGVGRHMVRE